jgi:hypothetical protein
MTSVRLPYVRRKRGNLFWEPTPAMRARGFGPKPLGPEGAESIAEARRLYASWLKALAEQPKVTDYPPGTFGAFWDRMRGSAERPSAWWAAKSARTREDYLRAWVHIDAWRPAGDGDERPTLSRTLISRIGADLCEQFYAHLATSVSPRERWRAIKSLKVLLSEAVVRLRLPYASPAARLVNPQPAGRTALWFGAEVAKLIATAEAQGYAGMALAIRLGWDTLFSPIDVWTIRKSWIRRDAAGQYIARDGGRAKTGREAFGYLSAATSAALEAYLEALGVELPPDGLVIRQRNGHAYRSKDTFGDDFRAVRAVAFPGDTRQFLDLRRSGNVEADAAGADKATMALILANTIDRSKFLDETYTPPTVTKAREVARQRLRGRKRLAGEMMRASQSDSSS